MRTAMRMTMRGAEWAVMAAALLVAGMRAWGQAPPPPPPPTMVLPPEVHSVRAAHRVAGSIMTEQPNFSELLAHCTAWKCACCSGGEANLLFPSD